MNLFSAAASAMTAPLRWWAGSNSQEQRRRNEQQEDRRDGTTTEKLASGPRGVVLPWFLPYFDNLTQETPAIRQAYRQMWANPEVKTALLSKIFGVSSLDLQVVPGGDRPEEKESAEFHDWMLNDLHPGGSRQIVENLAIGALTDGYSINEKIIRPQLDGDWAGKWPVAELKPKLVDQDVILETDAFRNVVSLMGLRYNGGEKWSPQDFVLMQFLAMYGQPTGMSDLRAAYQAYWLLDTSWKLRALAVEKRAMPVIAGFYEQQQQKSALDNALAKVRSLSYLSAPTTARIEALNIAGTADQIFQSTCKDLAHRIFLGITGAYLQSIEGSLTGSRAMGKTHAETTELFVWHLARLCETTINTQVLTPSHALNFGVGKPPKAVLSTIDEEALESASKVDLALQEMGLKLSAKEARKRYGREEPEGPEDVLQPVPKGGAAGAGGGVGAVSASIPGGVPRPAAPAPPQPKPPTVTPPAAGQPAPAKAAEEFDEGKDVALAGADGLQAEQLLRASLKNGRETLAKLSQAALGRYMEKYLKKNPVA